VRAESNAFRRISDPRRLVTGLLEPRRKREAGSMKTNGSVSADRPGPESDERAHGEAELAPEILDLLEKSAAVPHGLAFVHCAPRECVATALGVHPDAVEATCECLDAEPRAAVIREYTRAVERRRTQPPPPPRTPSVRVQRGPDDVIEAAENHSLGLSFLMGAPLETAAIMFAAHPDVVSEARERLSRRGVVSERAGDDA
jgi:hypothetical protein